MTFIDDIRKRGWQKKAQRAGLKIGQRIHSSGEIGIREAAQIVADEFEMPLEQAIGIVKGLKGVDPVL